MLATGALIASLLAVGASPTGAQSASYSDKANEATVLSACVGDALGDQMFTDVSDDHAFQDAINCIAYYGVTNGTGDGSTYSPNDDVTRAQMAVFIARAAKAAGVDLGDAMGDEFTDIGGTWAEARGAINRLASKGVIAKGGAFRPDDAITRAEMASFLVGMLAKVAVAPNVTRNADGVVTDLGSTSEFNYFGDARGSQSRRVDSEISALYELGITKGASAAAVQDATKAPLDLNYEPAGTVNRGQMAAFITRALAHTEARPAGVSAQYDTDNQRVVLSARDADFRPVTSGVMIDVFSIDTSAVDLAFSATGSCSGEVIRLGFGSEPCEIESSDLSTGGDGDATVPLAAADIAEGGTTVWAWTGETRETVGSDTKRYRLDIAKPAASRVAANAVRVTSEHPAGIGNNNNKKAHLGSSVAYTLQLQDINGNNTTVGAVATSGPARFLVRLETYEIGFDSSTPPVLERKASASSVTTLTLTTDADGKATFSVSGGPAAPGATRDQYVVDVHVQAAPGDNAPGNIAIGTGTPSAFAASPGTAVRAGTASGTGYATTDNNDLVFSTEPSSRTATGGASASVKSAATFIAASNRGTGNQATVSVVDQYGDPVPSALVRLTTDRTGVTIANDRVVTVGRDGSYPFGYQLALTGNTAVTETLTAFWDDNGDGCAAATCTGTLTAGVAGATTATVHWAPNVVDVAASRTQTASGSGDYYIREFDTDANRIFVAQVTGTTVTAGSARVLYYDSGDRFNVGDTAGVALNEIPASNYAGFEKALKVGKQLTWIVAERGSSRDINIFGVTPGS